MSLVILDYCFSVHELNIYMTWMLDYMYMYAWPISPLNAWLFVMSTLRFRSWRLVCYFYAKQ